MADVRLIQGDVLESLKALPDCSVQCCVTSPPYWGLRDYGVAGQLGLEPTPEEYVARMVEVFREVRRVLRDDGVMVLNIGDSYSSGNSGQTCRDSSGGVGGGITGWSLGVGRSGGGVHVSTANTFSKPCQP